MEDEFSAYVAARWPRLVRSAVLLGCSPAEAEDVAQSALLRCLIHWKRVARADDRDAYVHQVLINTFVSSRRRRWQAEKPVAAVPDSVAPDALASVEVADVVLRALDRLPTEQRVAVVLRYYLDMSEAQMVEVLNVRTGTVKSRLARALAALGADAELEEHRGVL
jgi:RNA polymerase sigma-70 factor (sigma-E family)